MALTEERLRDMEAIAIEERAHGTLETADALGELLAEVKRLRHCIRAEIDRLATPSDYRTWLLLGGIALSLEYVLSGEKHLDCETCEATP